jgi:4-cresol dehydrogenase (hydroxylating)
LGIPLWTGVIGIYGSDGQVRVNHERILSVLQKISAHTLELDTNKKTDSAELKSKSEPFERFIKSAFRGMTGQVAKVTQRPRWRKKAKKNFDDWSKDGCGIIWFPVTAPFRGSDVSQAVRIYRDLVGRFGFEPDMSVSSIRERTLEINASIVWDRDDESQEMSAAPCVKATLAELAKAGFYPHRLGLSTMDRIDEMDRGTRALLGKIKRALDPNGILARGRYL